MSNGTTITTQQYWDQFAGADFDPDVHRDDLRKADRISFPGAGGITVFGHVGSLTETGYRVAVIVQGLPKDPVWTEVAAADVTPAPLVTV